MVVLYDTAVRADWNIDAGLFEVFVTGFCYLNYCGCLSTTDTLLLTGDADGAAADADLNKVCACFCQEEEAFAVYYVTCADLNGVAVFCTDEVDGAFLPLGEALGGVDAQYVCTGFYQSRYTLFIVAGVDTGADYIAFVCIQQLVCIFFMRGVVLAEYKVFESLVFIHQWQRVELVLPDDVICFLQGGVSICHDEVFELGHKLADRSIQAHSADTVVTAGYDTDQFAGSSSVLGNSNGGVTGFFFQRQDVLEGLIRADVGIAGNKACFVAFYSCNHCCLVSYRLRTINKGNTALFCQCDCHFIVGYRLHDRRNQRNVHGQWALFLTFFKFYQWGFQADVRRNALRRRIARYQQVLTKGMGRLIKIVCHNLNAPHINLKFVPDNTAYISNYDTISLQ